jgi:tetratricopeptide (TPR) repeat protein
VKVGRAAITVVGVVSVAAPFCPAPAPPRLQGRDSVARLGYREVLARTGAAYRSRPGSDWAGDALLLLGRARLRLGELHAAHAALQAARDRVDASARGTVDVYLAAALAEAGRDAEALDAVNRALEGPLDYPAQAEALLVRGRLLLSAGVVEAGLVDLAGAIETRRDVRVEAGLTRLDWAVQAGDLDRAGDALEALLSYGEGGDRIEAIKDLIADAANRWTTGVAAQLLAAVGSSAWEREARGRIHLERARLLHASGDTVSAAEQAWSVARGLGAASDEARALLARWRLAAARDLPEVYSVRTILLPAGGHPETDLLVEAIDALESYTDRGYERPLAWFAAAETARDRLGANSVAHGLFLAYADGAGEAPWAAKALLAALAVSPSEGDRAWLRGRLEAHARSPYVLAATGGATAGFEALEEELQVRLREITGR